MYLVPSANRAWLRSERWKRRAYPGEIAHAEDGFSHGIPGLKPAPDIALVGTAEEALKKLFGSLLPPAKAGSKRKINTCRHD